MFPPFSKRNKALGVARERRRYDLPLNSDAGTGFLKLLIGLMTLLAILALSASFVLEAASARWVSGLENRATVEIPAEDADGKLLAQQDVQEMTGKAAEILRTHPAIVSADAMTKEEIAALVSPWLGEDPALEGFPLPGIVSVTLQDGAEIDFPALEKRIRASGVPQARIDTHATWLADILRFTGALRMAAAMLTLIIGITTFAAVAGAVRARMAVHREELELLHLMGATDSYITRQIQTHTLILALQGALAGTAAGGVILWLISRISGETGAALLPDFTLTPIHMAVLAAAPLSAALLAMITARFTVLRVLGRMP